MFGRPSVCLFACVWLPVCFWLCYVLSFMAFVAYVCFVVVVVIVVACRVPFLVVVCLVVCLRVRSFVRLSRV